ncbi:MAG: PQQ-binding-like beta-propeller repeat protein [Phycisphaerales bacterium]|nr:PQQ-binding-like beta-propeller repeat protein [Phycisphaerales bacterium]
MYPLVRACMLTLLLLSPTGLRADDKTECSWPMFRGGPLQTGVAHSSIPNKPTVKWSHTVKDAAFTTAAAIDAHSVFVGDDSGTLYAFDRSNGIVRWKINVGDSVPISSTPTIIGGVVYFGDEAGVLRALDVRDGSERWTFKTEGAIVSGVNHVDHRLVFGSYDGSLYCLDQPTGKLLWKFQTDDKIHGTPAIVKDRILMAGCDSKMHVVDLAKGTELSHIPLGSVSGSSAAIAGSLAFIGTYGNEVIGIDWHKAEVAWRFSDPHRQFPFVASAALTDRLVVIGGRDKHVHAINQKSGEEVWSFNAKGRVEGSAVIAGNIAIVGTQRGVLFGIDTNTGKEAWHFEAGDSITASPAVACQCIVIGTDDGVLYCLESKPGGA